jgi:uncharacterized protein YdaU (DUF1376 family)
MHFYPHNIADFNNATRHLTRVERSVYREAIDLYYDTEEPLQSCNFDKLCRVLLCVTDEEKQALRSVLDEFFELTDAGHFHSRCNAEIEKYRSNSSAKARAGKASAEARKNRSIAPVEHVLNSVEQTNNKELINNNQELVITPLPASQDKPAKKPDLDYSQWPSMPSEQTMQDWLAMRKRLKATVSQTVINRFAVELKKAKAYGYTVDQCLSECVTRGWRGFEVQWLLNSSQQGQYKTAAEKAAIRNESTFDYEKARDF